MDEDPVILLGRLCNAIKSELDNSSSEALDWRLLRAILAEFLEKHSLRYSPENIRKINDPTGFPTHLNSLHSIIKKIEDERRVEEYNEFAKTIVFGPDDDIAELSKEEIETLYDQVDGLQKLVESNQDLDETKRSVILALIQRIRTELEQQRNPRDVVCDILGKILSARPSKKLLSGAIVHIAAIMTIIDHGQSMLSFDEKNSEQVILQLPCEAPSETEDTSDDDPIDTPFKLEPNDQTKHT